MSLTDPDISIIIPVFNEEGNITPLLTDIEKACRGLSYETIIVNDGSSDGTKTEAQEFCSRQSGFKLLNLKKNFGQTAAMAAGIDFSKGKTIIPIDGDRQNDPADIPRLQDKMKEGFDVVSGWRKDRQDPFFSRKFPSWVANRLISYVTGVHLHDYGCSLKAYRASLIKNIQLSGEMHRFLPAWCAWRGGVVTELPVAHHARRHGKSKYGLFRIVKVIIDLMTVKFFSGYIAKPNYLFSGSGLLFSLLSLLAGGWAFFDKFGPNQIPEYRIPLLLFSGFAGLIAVFLFLLGCLAELLVRMYFSVRDQKSYILDNEIIS